jgi:hypothetical protein
MSDPPNQAARPVSCIDRHIVFRSGIVHLPLDWALVPTRADLHADYVTYLAQPAAAERG